MQETADTRESLRESYLWVTTGEERLSAGLNERDRLRTHFTARGVRPSLEAILGAMALLEYIYPVCGAERELLGALALTYLP